MKLIKLSYLHCSCKNKENLKVIKNTMRNQEILKASCITLTVGKLFNYCVQFVLFTLLCFNWSVEKHRVTKILQRVWETFLYQNSRKYNSYKFSCKFVLIKFLSFRRNQKQELNLQQVCWPGNEKYFCFLFIASRILLQSYDEFL